MSAEARVKVSGVVYDGTTLASQLRTDLSYLTMMALLTLDTPIREHKHPYIQVASLDTHLHMHDQIMPVAPSILAQLKADIPALHGSSLQINHGFGAGSMEFSSASKDALKAELVAFRRALEDTPAALKSIHTALTPLRVPEAALG